MILSKDNDTLNLTASILSAKSMLQSKLDGIGIDVRNIENALNALQNEIVQLKVEVEETKEELTTTAEELKDTTDNDKIKHLIDEVETTLDEIEIDDDILDGLCLSDFISDPVCGAECHGQHGETSSGSGTSCDCYGYREGEVITCPARQYSSEGGQCPTGEYTPCGQVFSNCTDGFCLSGYVTEGACPRVSAYSCTPDFEGIVCESAHQNDCQRDFIVDTGKGMICTQTYVEIGLRCEVAYQLHDDDQECAEGFTDHGTTCKDSYHIVGTTTLFCDEGYSSPDTGEHCEYYYYNDVDMGISCLNDYNDEGRACNSGYKVDSNGIVSCASGHSGDDGSCEGGHTWKDDIGGSCESIFHNSTMNCQGGVAQDKTEERLECNSIYISGNINCHGGYGEDIDDQITFCPSNFTNGVTTCRNMYMKQNGVETCTNNDPISCGSCVGGYCDYCGGCVGNCDSCRGCHGSSDCGSCDGSCVSSCDGNCWHTTVNTCDGCYPSPYNTTCGAPSCGTVYDYCAANSHSITCTGGF